MIISSEQEILAKLLVELRSTNSTSSRIITLLNDIEFYLHSIDNANYFSDAGGLELLVNLLADSTDAEMVASLCLTIGSASHSNPYVSDQLNSMGANAVLLKHLDRFTAIAEELPVRRIIFTLSAVSCSSTAGLESFLSGDGLPLFS